MGPRRRRLSRPFDSWSRRNEEGWWDSGVKRGDPGTMKVVGGVLPEGAGGR